MALSMISLINVSRLTYTSTPYLILLNAKKVSIPVEFINPVNEMILDDDPNIIAGGV
jgi:hypothetical protein